MNLNEYLCPPNGNRLGLHWTPVPYHDNADLTYFLDRVVEMGVGWVCLLDDGGGSTLQPNPYYDDKCIIDMFLERGIVPVVRLFSSPWAKCDSRAEDTIRRLVAKGVRWVFLHNEPECPREWEPEEGHPQPKTWVHDCTRLFVDFAYKAMKLGAYPGWWATTTFRWEDENGNRVNPFLAYMTEQERQDIFVNGHGWIPIHPYAKNHPEDYPYDEVNRSGKHITQAEFDAKIAEVPEPYRQKYGGTWVWEKWETGPAHINLLRDEGKKPDATIDSDDTCFLMFFGLLDLLKEAGLEGLVPLLGTEVGPCMGERDDGRYARVTWQEQIRMIDAELEIAGNYDEFFALMFWIVGVARLAATTQDSFEDQSWFGHRQDELTGLYGELPVVQHLIDRRKKVNESKLCPHVQYLDSATLEAIGRVKPPMVKIMNASREQLISIRAASPGSLIVARVFEENQDYTTNPEQAGQRFAEQFADIVDLIDVAEVFNEAINNLCSLDKCHLFDRYQCAFAQRLWEYRENVKIGLFCVPTGNMGFSGEPQLDPVWFPKTFALPVSKVYICVHEYTWYGYTYDLGYRMWRYPVQMQYAAPRGYKCLITECGFTQAILENHPDIGWRSDSQMWPRGKYVENLHRYDVELQRDDYVVGAAIFTCGQNSGWDTFESLTEWEEAVEVCAEPEEPEQPPEEEEPVIIPDAIIDIPEDWEVRVDAPILTPGCKYTYVQRVRVLPPNENNGNHHVYVNVVDLTGTRLYNSTVEVENTGNGWRGQIPMEKAAPEPMGNYSMQKGDTVDVWVSRAGGWPVVSDRVVGMHTRHADIGVGSTWGHHSFEITFVFVDGYDVPEPEPPEDPDPTESLEQFVRRTTWDEIGVDYNPTTALFSFARSHGMGKPETQEFDVNYGGNTWRVQGYTGGIVYCPVGEWDKVVGISWL